MPLPLSTKLSQLGNVPVTLRAGVGKPLVVTVKVPACHGECGRCRTRDRGAKSTTKVKFCTTDPAALVAVTVNG